MRALTLSTLALAGLLVGCAKPTDTDSDTDSDTDVVDTEVADLDASGWVVNQAAPQTFTFTLEAGENSVDLDFSENVSHVVNAPTNLNLRNYIGEVTGPNPFSANPPNLTLEARVIVPEDERETGDHECVGAGMYGLTLALYGPSDRVPIKLFTSARLEQDDTRPCTISIETQTLQRFKATVATGTLVDRDGDEVRFSNMVVDMILRDTNAAE
ncbi:MAG: hypothetical protein H6733_03420 [Alphaproteobacteria bacterium]|nr:hypothetical protein [Alphaproteobacteria bacterium]